jgi:hypothetical protein
MQSHTFFVLNYLLLKLTQEHRGLNGMTTDCQIIQYLIDSFKPKLNSQYMTINLSLLHSLSSKDAGYNDIHNLQF